MTPTRKRLAILATSVALLSGLGGGLAHAQAAPVPPADPATPWLCGSVWPVAGMCLDSPLRWVDDVVGVPPSPAATR